jgi:ribosomal protein S7
VKKAIEKVKGGYKVRDLHKGGTAEKTPISLEKAKRQLRAIEWSMHKGRKGK